MLKRLLLTTLLLLGLPLYASVVEVDLLGKLDDIEEHASPQQFHAKYDIVQLLVTCEFDEQCELNLKEELQKRVMGEKNIIYSAFLKYLEWEKHDLEYNIKHCQIQEKKELRKVYAQCYQAWLDELKNNPPQYRSDIDKIEHNRYVCIKDKATPLAQQNNIFAQADLVNLGEHFKDPKAMALWEAKINAQKGSEKYKRYMQCSEIP